LLIKKDQRAEHRPVERWTGTKMTFGSVGTR
jgi:hypothetical protein